MNDIYGEQTPLEGWTFPFCPAQTHWAIDWESMQARFAWIAAMAGVPQEAQYHAEGNVLIHTRMVVEALVALDEWRALPPGERAIMFAAALLHDIAKPACTKIEEDGRITSKNHARAGEKVARQLLWQGHDFAEPVPFPCREYIARLVRFHGLPLWFLDKPDAARAVIAASHVVRLDRVALLAEADVRGRICQDRDELLARIALFREFCKELGCYDRTRQFPTSHSRFVYFRSENASPDYQAYDDTQFEVVMMSGLPGAGKDHWLKNHLPGWPVISLDQIRRELKIAPTNAQGHVVQTAKERARALLRQHRSFAWNATNATKTMRRQLIDLFAAYHARIRIVYIDAPFAVLTGQNTARQESVPQEVIVRLMRKLNVPDLTEAHEVEWVWRESLT
ncbi:MAG: AAA family ATPase [Chloroflexota bacterium]|nr:AAA family ATPase [Chloroflexota bacterium]